MRGDPPSPRLATSGTGSGARATDAAARGRGGCHQPGLLALVTIGGRLAGGDARRFGGLCGDAGGVCLDGRALERHRQVPGGIALAGQDGTGVARLGVDPVDLGEPGSGGLLQVRGVAADRPLAPEAGLGLVLGGAHRARVGSRRRGIGAGFVAVVLALGRAEGLLDSGRLRLRAGGDFAAFVGDPSEFHARPAWRLGRRAEGGGRRREARVLAHRDDRFGTLKDRHGGRHRDRRHGRGGRAGGEGAHLDQCRDRSRRTPG